MGSFVIENEKKKLKYCQEKYAAQKVISVKHY